MSEQFGSIEVGDDRTVVILGEGASLDAAYQMQRQTTLDRQTAEARLQAAADKLPAIATFRQFKPETGELLLDTPRGVARTQPFLTNAAIAEGDAVRVFSSRSAGRGAPQASVFAGRGDIPAKKKSFAVKPKTAKSIALPCGRPIFVKLQDIFYELEPVSWPVSAVNGDVVTVDSGTSSPIISETTAQTRYGFEVYYSTDSGGEIAGLSLGSNYYIRSENDGESNSFLNYADSNLGNLVTLGSYTAPVDVNLRSLGGGLDDRVLGQTYEEWIAGLVPSPIGNSYFVYPIDPSTVQIELQFTYLTEDTSPKAGASLRTQFNNSSRVFRATMLGIFDFVVDAPGDYEWKIEQELGVITEVISGTVTVTEDNERLSNGFYIARPEPADNLTSFGVSSVIPNGPGPGANTMIAPGHGLSTGDRIAFTYENGNPIRTFWGVLLAGYPNIETPISYYYANVINNDEFQVCKNPDLDVVNLTEELSPDKPLSKLRVWRLSNPLAIVHHVAVQAFPRDSPVYTLTYERV